MHMLLTVAKGRRSFISTTATMTDCVTDKVVIDTGFSPLFDASKPIPVIEHNIFNLYYLYHYYAKSLIELRKHFIKITYLQPYSSASLKAVITISNPFSPVPHESVWYLSVTKLVIVKIIPLFPTEAGVSEQDIFAYNTNNEVDSNTIVLHQNYIDKKKIAVIQKNLPLNCHKYELHHKSSTCHCSQCLDA